MSTRTLNTLMGSHSPTANGLTVHGGNRRDRTAYRIDAAELAAWTAANARARRAYQIQPNSTRAPIVRLYRRGTR